MGIYRWTTSQSVKPNLYLDMGTGSENQNMIRQQLFKIVDADGSGFVDKKEMTHVLRCLGLQYSSPEIDQLIREFDDDNSGTVELGEFINIFDKMGLRIYDRDLDIVRLLRRKKEPLHYIK